MSDLAVSEPSRAPLDDLMMAMDVVDTLRHRERVLERELDSESRDARLLERLREIYAAQGIAVPDDILAEGVEALRRDRFTYVPARGGLARWLAERYVSRDRWGKWLLGIGVLGVLAWGGYDLLVERPAERQATAIPAALERTYREIREQSRDPEADEQAQAFHQDGLEALERDALDDAANALREIESLRDRLARRFELRVVSRPGAESGVWRVPDVNTAARNYYLIVEAVDPSGNPVAVPIRSEEDGSLRNVSSWGVRVDEQTFRRYAADKQQDGIIDDPVIGRKARGRLDVEYSIATSGGAITEW